MGEGKDGWCPVGLSQNAKYFLIINPVDLKHKSEPSLKKEYNAYPQVRIEPSNVTFSKTLCRCTMTAPIVFNIHSNNNYFIFLQASLGIAELCVMAMKKEGTSDEDARARIYLVDSKGLVVKNRPEGGLNEHKLHFAKDCPPVRTLAEVVTLTKPTVLIGMFNFLYCMNFIIK